IFFKIKNVFKYIKSEGRKAERRIKRHCVCYFSRKTAFLIIPAQTALVLYFIGVFNVNVISLQ
ncbi:MAG TPA: hypothetical protein PKJ42_10105, partial [Candidatus Goldiibacteriota bacterium]|nr:hypothetical protein [Candidatus Goldiibacteriota bacterium]